MGFWFYMLGCCLLIPAVMIFSGRMMWKHHPKQVNALMGYRTTRSTKNEETWKFANQYCRHLYEKIGWTTLFLPVPVMLIFLRSSKDVIGTAGTVICIIQCIGLLLPIIPTENALKKHFTDNETPRTPMNPNK